MFFKVVSQGARSFKLAQLIEDLVKIKKKNHSIIFELSPFANFAIENLINQKPVSNLRSGFEIIS